MKNNVIIYISKIHKAHKCVISFLISYGSLCWRKIEIRQISNFPFMNPDPGFLVGSVFEALVRSVFGIFGSICTRFYCRMEARSGLSVESGYGIFQRVGFGYSTGSDQEWYPVFPKDRSIRIKHSLFIQPSNFSKGWYPGPVLIIRILNQNL